MIPSASEATNTTTVRPIDPAFLPKRPAALYTGSSVRQLDYARARGDLAFYRMGGKVVYAVTDLHKWMRRFRVDTDDIEKGVA